MYIYIYIYIYIYNQCLYWVMSWKGSAKGKAYHANNGRDLRKKMTCFDNYFHGLVQDCNISNALPMETRQSFTKSSICVFHGFVRNKRTKVWPEICNKSKSITRYGTVDNNIWLMNDPELYHFFLVGNITPYRRVSSCGLVHVLLPLSFRVTWYSCIHMIVSMSVKQHVHGSINHMHSLRMTWPHQNKTKNNTTPHA